MAEQEFYYTDEKSLQKEQSILKSYSIFVSSQHIDSINFMFPFVCMHVSFSSLLNHALPVYHTFLVISKCMFLSCWYVFLLAAYLVAHT